jgi:aerobic-type carbon monoxide dehydrogenase small subunit (CoxS/CutS family)
MMDDLDEVVNVHCVVNGAARLLKGDPMEPTSAVLRRQGIYSVRETCSLGVCGTCTIRVDGEPVSSCILPLYAVEGRTVETAEGLERNGELSALQEQFIESQAFQCSFCTPGFLMSGQALLDRTSGALSYVEIREGLQGHLCRCGCYETVTEAISSCAARRVEVAPAVRGGNSS